MLPQELATHYEQLRERAIKGREDRSSAGGILHRQGLWAWMIAVTAEQVHGNECRASSTANTLSLSSSMPTSPTTPGGGELLAAWADLLVGVITQREATP